MARFSPGLLSSIRDFGSSLTSSQVDATGAPASLGGMLARNVGGLLGRDMRTTAEKAQAELRAIDPRDPDAQLKGLEVIARYGTPAQIQAAFTKMQEIQTQRQDRQTEQARIDRFRGSLIQRSKELGLGEARQDTILNADLPELKEIRKELLVEEQAKVASLRGKAGKRAIAIQAGYRGQALENVTNLDSDSFTGVMSGLETSEEALKNTNTGEVDIYRVNKYGMIVDEGPEGNPVFTPIDDQDLIPAPKQTEDIGRANQLTTELAKEGVKGFTEVTQAARDAYRSLDVSRSRLNLLQDNPNLITGGKLSELSTNVLITLASSLGIRVPATADAEAAQLLIAQGVEEVGQTIKAFGAGTGLSDADREFARIGAGATQDLTAENIKRMVELRIEAAEEAIRLHQGIYNTLKEEGASASSLAFYSVRPNLPADLQQYYD
jgi:hypothetical protein